MTEVIEPLERKKPPLFEYAYISNLAKFFEELRNLAMEETWEYTNTENKYPYPILFNYIHHTFSRLIEQNNIMETGKYSCFNTGLVTENQEEIFMLFKTSDDNRRFFVTLCKESDSNMNRFSPLPEKATYFSDPSELIFDPRLELRINIDHIIDDPQNFERFPDDLKKMEKHQLINTFNGTIMHTTKRAKRNYKTAIPQFYRGLQSPKGQLQLLLPLCFKTPRKADLALAIYKFKGAYIGKTCLTLDMAINNARLIAKPDDEWLKP